MPIHLNAQAVIYVAIFLATNLFTAGGAWVWVKQKQSQTRRDLNGIGGKVRRFEALLVRWADSDAKREQVARAIEGK